MAAARLSGQTVPVGGCSRVGLYPRPGPHLRFPSSCFLAAGERGCQTGPKVVDEATPPPTSSCYFPFELGRGRLTLPWPGRTRAQRGGGRAELSASPLLPSSFKSGRSCATSCQMFRLLFDTASLPGSLGRHRCLGSRSLGYGGKSGRWNALPRHSASAREGTSLGGEKCSRAWLQANWGGKNHEAMRCAGVLSTLVEERVFLPWFLLEVGRVGGGGEVRSEWDRGEAVWVSAKWVAKSSLGRAAPVSLTGSTIWQVKLPTSVSGWKNVREESSFYNTVGRRRRKKIESL